MGNTLCLCMEREKKQNHVTFSNKISEKVVKMIEEEKKKMSLIPKLQDFASRYKIVQQKKNHEKNGLELQYFNIKKAKLVNSRKKQLYHIKECRKFHLNKIIRQLTENEIDFVESVSHMNVYSPFEMYEEQDKIHLVYEELKGGTLLDVLNKCIQNDTILIGDEIGAIMYQLASVLSFMHSKGYVHRDLKPENIGFPNENDFRNLKITSFLTVKKRKDGDIMSGINGTYLYMAPEMLMEEPYDEKVDVWSLGVIYYMLIALQHPINLNDNEIQRQNLKEKLIQKFKFVSRDELIDLNREEFKGYSSLVPELGRKMLELNPKKRLTAKDIMNNRWVSENYKSYKKRMLQEMRKSNKHQEYTEAFLAFKAKKLKKALFSYFANILATREDKELFSEMFRMMDVDGNGVITTDEFEAAMVKFDQINGAANIKDLTSQILKKGYSMEIHEFINSAIVFHLIQQDQEKILKQMFDALDSEHKGEIEIDDLIEIFRDQGIPSVYIEMIIDYCDKDRNNKISFNEFREFILKDDENKL